MAPPDEAVRAYEQARAHYKAGRYPAAIEELERALSLDPDSPELVYNVARVYELMGDLGKAVGYYRRYRDMLPESDSEERARAEETIARLQGARQYVETKEPELPAAPPPPPPPAPAKPPPRGRADGAVWAMLGLAGGGVVSGAVSGGVALKREKELRDFVLGEDGGSGQRAALARKADRLALSSDVLLGAGALAALTALALYLGRSAPPSEPQTEGSLRLSPAFSSRGAGVSFSGAF